VKVHPLFLIAILSAISPGFVSSALPAGLDGMSPADANLIQSYAPVMITREMWGARPASSSMKPHHPSAIIIHHTGVAANPLITIEAKMRNLQAFSQKEKHRSPMGTTSMWPDVPYHFYIDLSGHIAEGRDIHFAGDTNTNYDTTGFIQVVVEGDFEKEFPSPEEVDAVESLLSWIMLNWTLAPKQITAHKDHASTDCPGRNFLASFSKIIANAADRRAAAVASLCKGDPGPKLRQLYCQSR